MPWLIRDGEVLATVEVAESLPARLRGLLGRDEWNGALLLPRSRSVHTIGMRFPIDVAFCDASLIVLEAVRMAPWRMGLPRPRSHYVVEASAGAFERWRLRPGDELEVKD